MVKLGQKVQFNPMDGISFPGCSDVQNTVTGTVVYINEPHHWFSAVYGDERPLRISFNFNDINKKVYLR